jgi:stage III sporulation protein SpoIIIAA
VQITWEDLKAAEEAVGEFGGDNRAGVQGTLHRISALRNRKGTVVGLTCRVGRAVTGHMDMIRDMIEGGRCCVGAAVCGQPCGARSSAHDTVNYGTVICSRAAHCT